VALPESEGHTKIMVVVDRFSKMTHFTVLSKTAIAKDTATAFLREIWKHHGLLKSIISN
jgi:hypothetical protein